MVFDYEGHWLDVIEPRWRELNPRHREIILKVTDNSNIQQGRNTAIDLTTVPESTQELVRGMDSYDLAVCCQIAHDYTHHRPGNADLLASYSETIGSGWKFSNLAGIFLCQRLGLTGSGVTKHPKGYFTQCLDGVIRPTLNGSEYWVWNDVGLATEENCEKLKKFKEKHGQPTYDTFDGWCNKLTNVLHPHGDPDRPLIDNSKYMVSDELREYLTKFRYCELRGRPLPEFKPLKDDGLLDFIKYTFPEGYGVRPTELTQVNYRLADGCSGGNRSIMYTNQELNHHPFVIGQDHMRNSQGSRLDPKSAPCDLCGNDYEDHLSDKALLLERNPLLPDDALTKILPHIIKILKPQLDQLGVETFGFPSSEEVPPPTVDLSTL